ncbi:alpha/beta hydrolase [bacterium]|nr:alpha/beta hydrolase [bacterium]
MVFYIVKLVIGSLILISGMLYFFQGKFVYAPSKKYIGTPADIGIKFEEVFFKSKNDVKICGWYVPAVPGDYTILFCHGNAGNISHRLKTLKIMHDLGYNFLIFDYQGYGKSEGTPTEEGTYSDTRAAYDYLINEKKCSEDKIIFQARSLGGGIATKVVTEKNPPVYILESTFTSVADVARKIYPFLPVDLLTRIKYPTIDNLKSISCPIFFVHSPDDEVIPFSHGKKLYESYNGKKTFFQLKGGHNEGLRISEKEYTAALKTFLDSHLKDKMTSRRER